MKARFVENQQMGQKYLIIIVYLLTAVTVSAHK